MAKLLINNTLAMEGKMTVERVLDDSSRPAVLTITNNSHLRKWELQ